MQARAPFVWLMAALAAMMTPGGQAFGLMPGDEPLDGDKRFEAIAGVFNANNIGTGNYARGTAILISPTRLIVPVHVVEWRTASGSNDPCVEPEYANPSQIRVRFIRKPGETRVSSTDPAIYHEVPAKRIWAPKTNEGDCINDTAIIELSESDAIQHIIPAYFAPPAAALPGTSGNYYYVGWGHTRYSDPQVPNYGQLVLGSIGVLRYQAISSKGYYRREPYFNQPRYLKPTISGGGVVVSGLTEYPLHRQAAAGDSGGVYCSVDPAGPVTPQRLRVHGQISSDFPENAWQLRGALAAIAGVSNAETLSLGPVDGRCVFSNATCSINTKVAASNDNGFLTSWSDSQNCGSALSNNGAATSASFGKSAYVSSTTLAQAQPEVADWRSCAMQGFVESSATSAWEVVKTGNSVALKLSLTGYSRYWVQRDEQAGDQATLEFVSEIKLHKAGNQQQPARFIIPFSVIAAPYSLGYGKVSVTSTATGGDSVASNSTLKWAVVSDPATCWNPLYDPTGGNDGNTYATYFSSLGPASVSPRPLSVSWNNGSVPPADLPIQLVPGTDYFFVIDILTTHWVRGIKSTACGSEMYQKDTPAVGIKIEFGQ